MNTVTNEQEEFDPVANYMYSIKLPSGRTFYCHESATHQDGMYLASAETGEWLDISYSDLPALIERLQKELDYRAEDAAMNAEREKLARWNAAAQGGAG